MEKKRQAELLRHLRAELVARRKHLAFLEKQAPIEVFEPPMFLSDVKSNLIEAAKAEMRVIEQAIEELERDHL